MFFPRLLNHQDTKTPSFFEFPLCLGALVAKTNGLSAESFYGRCQSNQGGAATPPYQVKEDLAVLPQQHLLLEKIMV